MRDSLVKFPRRASQWTDFSNLEYGTVTPTDIDGLIEWHDRGYVFFELKYRNKYVPAGQRLALERLVRDTWRSGKKSIAIVAEHDVDDTRKPVFVADCYVREIYYGREMEWRPPDRFITCKEAVDEFMRGV